MQIALDHFSTNQPGEYPKASEEDSQSDVVELYDSREYARIFAHHEVLISAHQSMYEDNEGWNERQKVYPARTP